MNYIGLDIGTTSICGIVLDGKTHKSLISITRKNDALLQNTDPLMRCQSPEAILQTLRAILDELLASYPDVKAIGITGQMHGIVYVDDRGEAVSPLYTWQDQHGDACYRDGKSYAQFASQKSGYTMATGYGIVTHFYHKAMGLIPPTATSIMTIADYAVMRLCGLNKVIMHISNAASLGCFDLQKLEFDNDALNMLEIDPAILPGIIQWPKTLGSYQGIPVTAAIGDNQASFLGSGADDDTVLVNIGTGSQVSVTCDEYVSIGGNVELRPYLGDRYLLVGSSLNGGRAYALLENFFRKVAALAGAETESMYSAMGRAIADYKEATTLQISTLFSGTRSDPTARGCIGNIGIDNFTPEQMILGFLSGITNELYSMYRTMSISKHRMMGSGNGLQKNPALISAVENTFSMPLTMTGNTEEAACGAAMCYALACG